MMRLTDFAKFLTFARGQYDLHDHYPHVRVFRQIATDRIRTMEGRFWLCFLYMAYYQDASAWLAYNEGSTARPRIVPAKEYPISYQRRNLFGGRITRHLQEMAAAPGYRDWLTECTWTQLLVNLQSIYGNGRWAAYTTAEMLCAMRLVDAQPDSYEIAGSSGPAQGLTFLGLPPTEDSARTVSRLLNAEGVDAPPQIVESFLCNWSRMCKGDFYLGCNIDRQQGRLLKITSPPDCLQHLWAARRKSLPQQCLGEFHGWNGLDKPRMRTYAATGKVLQPWEERA